MQALRVDWIIDDQGKALLEAISQSENDELFTSKSIVVIIEFLYFKYRSSVLKTSLPFYVIQLILYYISVLIKVPNDQDEEK